MTWLKIDHRFGDGPAASKAGDSAMGAWLRLACWLATFPEQGNKVPPASVRRLTSRSQRRDLQAAGLLIEREDYFEFYRDLDADACGLSGEAWQVQINSQRPGIPAVIRSAVYERDGYACSQCGSTGDLSLDHIWPYSRGGSDTLENLQTLCRPCNSRKGAGV